MKHILTALFLLSPVGVQAGQSLDQPNKLAVGAINLDDQITLTPAFSPDGRFAYFPQSACTQIGPCPQLLRVSEKVDGQWQPSKPISKLNRGRVDWPSVTPDGNYLLFSWSAPRDRYADLEVYEDFDLYRLDLNNPDAVPEALDAVYGDAADLNRPRHGSFGKLRYVHNSTAPVMTANGDLYFWSERFDAMGERDIFLSERQTNGTQAAAVPLPTPINSTGRDNHAWVSPEGGLMLITYSARGGEGGADIFVSRKEGNVWSDPENLGPHLNGPAADFAAKLTPNKSEVVFTSTRDGRTLQVYTLPTQILIDDGVLTAADLLR
ncbi:MAG: hypothetical protein ABJN22_12560 [Litorimonas sp.]